MQIRHLISSQISYRDGGGKENSIHIFRDEEGERKRKREREREREERESREDVVLLSATINSPH